MSWTATGGLLANLLAYSCTNWANCSWGTKWFTAPHQLIGSTHTNDTGEEIGPTIARDEPHIDIAHDKFRPLRSNTNIGHAGHIHAGPGGRAIDGSNVGLVEPRHRAWHPVHAIAHMMT